MAQHGLRGRAGVATRWLLPARPPFPRNPRLARGTKDQDSCRIFYEPLGGWDGEGNLIPVLAAEVPTRANGGLSADGRTVTWKLKRGVKWHDGRDFTADDVIFTWQYAGDPASAMLTVNIYRDIKAVPYKHLTLPTNRTA